MTGARETSGDAARDTRSFTTGTTLVLAALLLLFAAALVKNAWISEDAHITLRTIDNFWHGYGLRWNPLERVQTYTHPLWMLLLGAVFGVTREGAYTTIAVGVACTIATLWVILRTLPPLRACVAIALLLGSRAFIDFSTSGLENPLTHALLAVFWLVFLREGAATPRRLAGLTAVASLLALTRTDNLLLVMPAVLVEAWRLPIRRSLPALAAGLLPLIAWHTFSLVYYGFVFPNTAYAKLGTGIPAATLAHRGLLYLLASLESDPITMIVIAGGTIAAFVHSGRRALIVGVPMILYLLYIIRIGGDYMNGRFLTGMFVFAALTLADMRWAERRRAAMMAIAATLAVAVVPVESALRLWRAAPVSYTSYIRHGVVNEQAGYYAMCGLLPMLQGARPADHAWGQLARQLSFFPQTRIHINVGILGYYGGPGLHLIDEMALSDPLLARLPSDTKEWFIGHYRRTTPVWYKQFLDRCVARVFPRTAVRPPSGDCLQFRGELDAIDDARSDADRVALYRDLLLVTQGPVWSRERLAAIVRLNLHGGRFVATR